MPKNESLNLDYIRKLYAPQDPLLAEIDAALHALGMPIHIGAEEGKLLQMLIRLHSAKNIVEIGTLAGSRITLMEGDAHDMLEQLRGEFDMVFIDADKISYLDYLDWAEKHIRKGGLIVADNTLLFGAAVHTEPPEEIAPNTWKNMRDFNQRLADTKKYFTTMIPTQEGLSVAIKLF